jgi:hypothetical protein
VTPDEIRGYAIGTNIESINKFPDQVSAAMTLGIAEMLRELTAQIAEIKELLKERNG